MHIRAMRQRGRQWIGEQLEPRRVLAVMGQIYHDVNGNGQRDTDEAAVYDRSVTLLHRTAGTLVAEEFAWGQDTDLNQDGVIDPLTETGVYSFPNVTPGSYELLFTDFSYEVTAPNDVDQSYRIEVTDAPVTDLDFGVRPLTSNFEPEAGDSNVDGYFDEADLIMAYKSGKYETGQPAGFGEGNWNLDDEFNSGDLVASFMRGYLPGESNARNELQPPTTSGQADVVLTYDGSTGQLTFSSEFPLSSIHVHSKSASMTTEADMFVFVPPFDIHDTSNRFLLKTAGITSVDYGNILPPGLTSQQLADDLLVDGSRQVGGDLGIVRVDCTNCLPPGTGEISGRFFHDANGDGVQSAGEPGIDGVTMRLMTEGVSLVTETTSVDLNADGTIDPLTEQGIYAFSSLPALNYTVQVDGTAWVTTLPSIGSYTFDLADGATLGDNLFGATYDGPLQPGDANQDYFVDAADLIQAFKLTSGLNTPADWASGDWNGAPGGKVGAPPFGNGFFNADDLTLAFPFYNQAGSYAPVASTPVNTLQPLVNRSDTDVALVYDAATGGALLYGASQWNLSIVQLHSDQGWFRDVERDPVFGAAFSSESANELVAFSGFNGGLLSNHELSLGATFAPGLTLAEIAAEVTIDGARLGGGSIGEVGVMSLAEYESQFGSLQGRVYADLNRNGQLDDGETSQATTPLIVLYDLASGERVRDVYPSPHDLNGNGAIDADENNAYVFERLPESRYRIEVETGDSYGLVTQLPESIEVFAGSITTGVDIGVLTRPRFDFNEDFVLDEADIALMCQAMNDVTFAERKFDLNTDQYIDIQDVKLLISVGFVTNYGDANLDGKFDSKDLVAIMAAGKYEDGIDDNASWSEGDWNCDGEFDALDLVLAFQTGTYQRDDAAAAIAAEAGAADDGAAGLIAADVAAALSSRETKGDDDVL